MPDFALRKMILTVEEIAHDFGPPPPAPRLRGAIVAIVANPFAHRFEPDLQPAMEDLKPLGLAMTDRLIAALGGRDGIDGYGKGAIVGEGGEVEHGALWHVPGGYAMRARLGESRAIVPSAMKVGGMS
ncbi:MAG: amino acid synthesis family protein, partial [Gemmobacter sp.]